MRLIHLGVLVIITFTILRVFTNIALTNFKMINNSDTWTKGTFSFALNEHFFTVYDYKKIVHNFFSQLQFPITTLVTVTLP